MRLVLFFGTCLGILSLSGCAGAFDPFQRPGTWAMTGASNETIAQQAANKSDLIQGRSQSGTNGIAAVAGVEKAMSGGTASGLQTPLQAQSSSASISTGS